MTSKSVTGLKPLSSKQGDSQQVLPASAPMPTIGNPVRWQSLPGGARGLILTALAQNSGHPWVVVAPDDATARACLADCLCFSDLDPERLLYFPDSEILPYDPQPAASSVVRERAIALEALSRWDGGPAILITTSTAYVRRLAGPEHWIDSALTLKAGDNISREKLIERLESLGYQEKPKVRYPGDYSQHPHVVDVYTTGRQGCLRVRFDGRLVTAIEPMHPDSQLTTGERADRLQCLPAREVPIDKDSEKRFEAGWRAAFGKALSDPVYKEINLSLKTAPIEALLPLFASKVTTILDWLPQGSAIYGLPGARDAAISFIDRGRTRFQELGSDTQRRLISPDRLWMTVEELNCLDAKKVIEEDLSGADLGFAPTGMTRQASLDDALAVLSPRFQSAKRIVLCVQTEGHAESMSLMAEMLGRPAQSAACGSAMLTHDSDVVIVRADVDQGFILDRLGVVMITEAEVFGSQIVQREEDANTSTAMDVMADLSMIEPGDPLVHARYGVGRFEGLEMVEYSGKQEQHLVMRYADDARIFVKMEDLDLVMRYQGGDVLDAPFDTVAGVRWESGMKDALRHAQTTAKELLKLYALRAALKGFPCDPAGFAYEKFCRSFAFKETPDQRAAINQVINDLVSEKPMDRIVSGDVGFGKTEVAMRAAFIAAYSGYQVVVLVPTTLLAQQHYESFTRRFAQFEFNIELLTRSSNDKSIVRGLTEGSVDIVIGTQRLFKDDVKLPRMGLLVIDEEHRFGVKDKERMTVLRQKANVLSMTATPIPRTLSMAMHGVRDISIISTPPAKRLSIRTLVDDLSFGLVREAIEREALRGGQVFYLHNSVKTIADKAQEVSAIVPSARVEYAHGQMNDLQLEDIMRRFNEHDFDVLVCTTIIEIGIDIPNANTILIEGADNFGLAQLHQLRGRVGRSQRQAYCYLLRGEREQTVSSKQRLAAMQRTAGLGEGLVLAHHDLEIRGAGEILGEAQAGDIQTVGFNLYLKLLERAIEMVRDGQSIAAMPTFRDGHFDLPAMGVLPESYIKNPAIRLSILSRLSRFKHIQEAVDFTQELQDRFGPMPKETASLLENAGLRFPLRAAGIDIIRFMGDNRYHVLIDPSSNLAHDLLRQCCASYPDVFSELNPLLYEMRPQESIMKTLGAMVSLLEAIKDAPSPT